MRLEVVRPSKSGPSKQFRTRADGNHPLARTCRPFADNRCDVPVSVRSHGAPAQAPRGRDRRPDALAVQSGQGPLPPRGVHQGPGDRLLHADRTGAAAAPAGASADAQALPERGRGEVLLREALPVTPAAVGADDGGLVGTQRGRHRLLPLRGPADDGLAREPGGSRAAHADGAGAGDGPPDDHRLRSRPGAAGDDRRVLAGRAGAAARVRVLGAGGVPEDVGLEGHAGLSAAEHDRDLRGHAGVLAWAGAAAGAA